MSGPTGRPVVLASHRGPVAFDRTDQGRTARRGAGGLVTALMGTAEHLPDVVWVCAAATAEDAAVAEEHEGAARVALAPQPHLTEGSDPQRTIPIRYVQLDERAHGDFYSRIANPLLWFVQHGLYGLGREPNITSETWRAYLDGYLSVNRAFADAVAEELTGRDRPICMLHDYHFYAVPALVRRRCPDAVISHFVHIPWPGPDGWRVLPPRMREELLLGLLGADVVAFHTRRFVENFLDCAEALLGLPVDRRAWTVSHEGRTVRARAYPISVDTGALDSLVAGEEVRRGRAAIEQAHLGDGRRLIVRVDRTDPSKNIVRGFRAFDTLLCEHPEWAGRVTFLASLMPSRQDVAEYSEYLAEIGAVAAEVNARHSREGWQPIDLRLHEDLSFALAAYSVADVLVVNSVNDGMNLVAKEAMVVSDRDCVLVLSETTGVHDELGEWALTVHPFDVAGQAGGLLEALQMPADERRRRRDAAAAAVRTGDVERWVSGQLEELAALG